MNKTFSGLRREQDLNLWYPYEHTSFPGMRIKPDSAISPIPYTYLMSLQGED